MWGNINDLADLFDELQHAFNQREGTHTVTLDAMDYDEDGYVLFNDKYVCTEDGAWLRIVIDPDTNTLDVIAEYPPVSSKDIEI